jgi:TetR/AcrR family transcriptional regulator, repressor for uid operon
VLDAAYELFSVIGIQRTSMEEVARRAGVSRQTVYRHVASRDALVEQVLRREFQRHVRHYLDAVAEAETSADRVVDGYLTTLQAIRSNPLLAGLLPVELNTLVASMADSAQNVLGLARLFIAQLLYIEKGAGEIPEHVDVDLVADVMVRLAVSYILIPSDVVDLDDPEATREMLHRLLAPMLGWAA